MNDLHNHSNFSSNNYQDVFSELERNIEMINPEKDYKAGLSLKSNGDSE